MKISRETGAASVGALLVLAAVALHVKPDTHAQWPSAAIREGEFVDAVVETGAVNAARLSLYSAPVGGAQSKIIALVPEGSSVSAGSELIRFDDAQLRQGLEKEQAAFRVAEADLLRAREDLRLEQLRSQADLQSAAQAIDFAERELTNQMEGKGRLDVVEAETSAAEAQRELERARTTYDDTKALLPEGFVTRLEVDRAEQALHRAEEMLKLARLKLDTITKFERPGTLDRSMAAVNSARGDLSRSTETTSSRLAQRRAALSAAESQVDQVRARVASLTDQLTRTVIRADGPGLVVYRELYFGSDHRKPQVGDEVWPNQPLLALPDSSQLVVETRVREIDLHKVAASQQVRVRFDAYPDLQLPASVALVGALAQEDAARAGTKYFPVTVKLLASDPRLRPGMTAQVEIQVASQPHAQLIPVDAVFGEGAATYAVVVSYGQPVRKPIVIGAANGTVAALRSGLAPGDHVLLIDPTKPNRSTPDSSKQ